jgi:nucleoside-diphosphate-sugar epimerase
VFPGTEGFIHVASPVGGIAELQVALDLGRSAALNALNACAKTPSVKRFVNTSSCFAASLPRPHLDEAFPIGSDTYNDDALEEAKTEETQRKGILIYAAMKSETEKAMWKWIEDNKPGFVFNSIVRKTTFASREHANCD